MNPGQGLALLLFQSNPVLLFGVSRHKGWGGWRLILPIRAQSLLAAPRTNICNWVIHSFVVCFPEGSTHVWSENPQLRYTGKLEIIWDQTTSDLLVYNLQLSNKYDYWDFSRTSNLTFQDTSVGQLSQFLRCVLLRAANYEWFFFRFHPRVVQSLRSHQISICHCYSELNIGTRRQGA